MGHPFTEPVGLTVGALAVARLTRLVTEDTLTGPLRRAAEAHSAQLAAFLGCPWCVGVWVAAGWAALAATAPGGAAVLGAVLAWSEVAGLLAEVS